MHRWIWKDMYRRKLQTLLKIALSFLLLFFLFVFCNNIKQNEEELQKIYDGYEVKMVVRSRQKGNEALPSLQKTELRQAEHADYVKDVDYIAKASMDVWKNVDSFVADAKEITVYLQEELDTVNERYLIGDDTKNLTDEEYIACGFYELSAEAIRFVLGEKEAVFQGEKKSDSLENDIYINYAQFERICQELELPYCLEIAVYTLQNTGELDWYRTYLNQQPIFRDGKCQYFIFDGVLQDATRSLKQIIAMMNTFLPIVFFLIGVLAFFVSYVSSRGEQRTLFLLYTLGVKKEARFFYVWSKEMLCCLISVLPGMLLLDMKYIVCYVLSFALGSGISALRMITGAQNLVEQEG